jgi:hypothetical protein
MTEAEFDAFVAEAMDELQHKQDALRRDAGLGSHARWSYDATTARLEFFDAAGTLKVGADALPVGSYASASKSWKWGWSNDSIPAPQRERAEKLKELAAITGLGVFARERAFAVDDEAVAWELTALAVHHLGALGCYRAPSSSGGPATFLAITKLELA